MNEKQHVKMREYGISILLMMMTFVFHDLSAQQRTFAVSGTVKNEAGTPLIGVTVVEKGRSNGTTTITDGSFRLMVQAREVNLVFSHIGYNSFERRVMADTPVTGCHRADHRALEK